MKIKFVFAGLSSRKILPRRNEVAARVGLEATRRRKSLSQNLVKASTDLGQKIGPKTIDLVLDLDLIKSESLLKIAIQRRRNQDTIQIGRRNCQRRPVGNDRGLLIRRSMISELLSN